jgi:hypothetical protein
MLNQDSECVDCKHTWYDHAGRFTVAELDAMKREVGCRIIGCGCARFHEAVDPVWEGQPVCSSFATDPNDIVAILDKFLKDYPLRTPPWFPRP